MAKPNLVNGRIVGGYSLHDAHKPELCKHDSKCFWRCVDCCGVKDDRDIVECSTCGQQKSVRCNFDEDFS